MGICFKLYERRSQVFEPGSSCDARSYIVVNIPGSSLSTRRVVSVAGPVSDEVTQDLFKWVDDRLKAIRELREGLHPMSP